MQITKRTLALLLAICLVLSLGAAIPVLAEEPTEVEYSFQYQNAVTFPTLSSGNASLSKSENVAALNDAYAANAINSTCFYWTTYNKPNITAKGFYANAYCGQWAAFKIQAPAEGSYQVTVEHYSSTKSPEVCNVYILPGDTASDSIASMLTEDYCIGSTDLNDKSALEQDIGYFIADADAKEYIVVFYAAKDYNGSETTNVATPFNLVSLTMTPAEIPEEDPSGSGGISFDLVAPEIVGDDIIRSGQFQYAQSGVNPANGHDYLYLFYRDSKMLVYDLDTGTKVDEETNAFNTPRGTYLDANGILWACGAGGRFLYRYDPATGTGERISFSPDSFPNITSWNSLGITGDEDGKIYFGTYNRGYLGMYDPQTGAVTNLTGWINTSETKEPDAVNVGFGGVVVADGYIYACVDGDANGDNITTHQIIKYSIAEQKIVAHKDISDCFDAQYLNYLAYVDGVLFGSTHGRLAKPVIVDTETMELINVPGLEGGFIGDVTVEKDGKAYIMGYLSHDSTDKCLFEYDAVTRTATPIRELSYVAPLRWNDCFVTIDDERLPGVSVMTVYYNSATGTSNPLFYNLETGNTLEWAAFTLGEGSGNQLRAIAIDPSGKTVYVGAYGNNQVGVFDVTTGTVAGLIPGYGHQVDGMLWYKDYMYLGSYSTGTITRLDVETGDLTPLFKLSDSAFAQERMHALAAGDNKVFCGTIPIKGNYGGVLVWYDMDAELTYVAAGPNPEDVYYADTSDLTKAHVWYSALTGEKADFDRDGDGVDDSDITLNTDSDGDGKLDVIQRFNGVIENQSINCIVYKDGYIYGSTTKSGGSGADADRYKENATLFVYDVAAMKVIATCDLCDEIENLAAIPYVDVIAEDPITEGKFWGVVSDTLFSFTFDAQAATYTVTEELSLGKASYYNGGDTYGHRSIVFDGNYMYVIFGNKGTYLVNRADVSEYGMLSTMVPRQMVMGADGNLYLVNNDADLKVLRTAEFTQPLVAESVQAMIDAIGTVTPESEAAITAARAAYDALSDGAKAMVKNLQKLLDAEEALIALQSPSTGDHMPLVLLTVLALFSAAMVAVLLTQKRMSVR